MKTEIELVEALNDACEEMTVDNGLSLRPFVFGSDGDQKWIKFMGQPIWCDTDGLLEEEVADEFFREIGLYIESMKKIDFSKLIGVAGLTPINPKK